MKYIVNLLIFCLPLLVQSVPGERDNPFALFFEEKLLISTKNFTDLERSSTRALNGIQKDSNGSFNREEAKDISQYLRRAIFYISGLTPDQNRWRAKKTTHQDVSQEFAQASLKKSKNIGDLEAKIAAQTQKEETFKSKMSELTEIQKNEFSKMQDELNQKFLMMSEDHEKRKTIMKDLLQEALQQDKTILSEGFSKTQKNLEETEGVLKDSLKKLGETLTAASIESQFDPKDFEDNIQRSLGAISSEKGDCSSASSSRIQSIITGYITYFDQITDMGAQTKKGLESTLFSLKTKAEEDIISHTRAEQEKMTLEMDTLREALGKATREKEVLDRAALSWSTYYKENPSFQKGEPLQGIIGWFVERTGYTQDPYYYYVTADSDKSTGDNTVFPWNQEIRRSLFIQLENPLELDSIALDAITAIERNYSKLLELAQEQEMVHPTAAAEIERMPVTRVEPTIEIQATEPVVQVASLQAKEAPIVAVPVQEPVAQIASPQKEGPGIAAVKQLGPSSSSPWPAPHYKGKKNK